MIDMNKMYEVGAQIRKAYDEDRYVDIDGNVWLGRGDERWYVEDKGHLEDPAYWLTNQQMMKKMCNELSGDEQFSRDEAVRLEALYEYAMQTKNLSGDWYETADPFIRLTRDQVIWADKESRVRLIEWCKEEAGPDYRLVRRRKAGPIKEVDM